MAKNQDLDVLGPLGSRPEHQELEDPAQGRVDEGPEHGRGFCHRNGAGANRRSPQRDGVCVPHAMSR